MVADDTVKFENWLRNNTSLRESTVRLYTRTIQHYIDNTENPESVESMNAYISHSVKIVNSYYVKYAFKHWLDFNKTPGKYKKLVKVRQPARKKLGKYLPPRTIINLIKSIEPQKYQDIAWLQFATGARAREIITLRSEHIDLDSYDNVIKIRLVTKRGKEQTQFLNKEKFHKMIERHMGEREGYLFINKNTKAVQLDLKTNNERTYYYNSLQRAASAIGIDTFGTHDFRRNVAEMLKKQNKNPLIIKRYLGHSRIETTIRYFEDNPEEILDTSLEHQQNMDVI